MAVVLLLSNAPGAAAEILPALDLLPHQVRVLPAEASSLVAAPPSEIILLDARTELARAKRLSQLVGATMATPVIVIVTEGGTAALTAEWEITDFVGDSVSPAELSARLRLARSPTPEPAETLITSGAVVIDETAYSARIGGTPLDLTYTEFELLKFLTQHPGRVFTRQQLVSEVWGYDYFGGTRTVDVHIRRLRAKLGPEHETLIGTVRNVGYRFLADP